MQAIIDALLSGLGGVAYSDAGANEQINAAELILRFAVDPEQRAKALEHVNTVARSTAQPSVRVRAARVALEHWARSNTERNK